MNSRASLTGRTQHHTGYQLQHTFLKMSEPVAIQASAGTDALTEAIIQSTVPKGAVITQEPILGEADKPAATEPEPHKPKSTTTEPEKAKTAAAESGKPEFFPANPSFPDKLAENKPVKELNKEGSGASGGIFRTISDVLVELRGKHQDKKRVGLHRPDHQTSCLHILGSLQCCYNVSQPSPAVMSQQWSLSYWPSNY